MAAAWETAGVALARPLRSGAFRGTIGCPERHGEHVEPLGVEMKWEEKAARSTRAESGGEA